MMVIEKIFRDAKSTQHTRWYLFKNVKIEYKDIDYYCEEPRYAYFFALHFNTEPRIADVDFRKCEEAACRDPKYAYCFGRNIKGADREKCLAIAKTDPKYRKIIADTEDAMEDAMEEAAKLRGAK